MGSHDQNAAGEASASPGPLAQQFARLREYLGRSVIPSENEHSPKLGDSLAALSVIERHVKDMEKALTGAQFCLHVEYLRYRDSVPDDPTEAVGRVEGMEILAETLNEIAVVIGPYYAGKVAALPASGTPEAAREKGEE